MKKLIFTFVALLTMVCGANAKSFTTTLWEGTSEGGAEINIEKSKFSDAKSGDAIRVTFSFTAEGSMHLCYKTGIGGDWGAKAFNGISEWPNYTDTNVTTATFAINATDLATLQSYGMYLYGFTSSTITKVELTGEIPPADETELLDENKTFTESWEWADFSAQSGAKIGDVIRLTFTAYKDDSTDWPYVQFNIKDSSNDNIVTLEESKAKNSVNTYDFEITNGTILEKIQTGGFKITGARFILTSVKLLTYADSYDAVAVTIGSDGIATFSSSKHLDFAGTGVTPYYASAVTTGTVTLTSTTTTWAWEGYILKGIANTYTVPVTAEANATYPSTHYLKQMANGGTVVASAGSTFHYIFAKHNGEIGFYKLTSDHTLAAKKAYLETTEDITPEDITPSNASTRGITLNFDDGTTAILPIFQDGNSSIAGTEDNACYTLQGIRVQNPTKGLYIVNGKKVVVR